MLFVAATSPEVSALGNWVIITVFCLMGLSTLVTLASYFATRREVTALEARMDKHVTDTKTTTDQLFSKVGGMERGLRNEFNAEMGQLHEKINGVHTSVARLEGHTELMRATMSNIDSKLDRMIERKSS